MALIEATHKKYLTVAYGKLRIKAEPNEAGAVKREFEGRSSWAFEYSAIEGVITSIYYKESKEFGNSYEVTINDGEELYNISLREDSRYCQDFLCKLPNLNFSQPLKITPYSMEVENNKIIHGISIRQDNVKIQNAFVEYDKDHDNKRIYKLGYPEPKSLNLSDKEYKIYLIEIQLFLSDYVKNKIIPELKSMYVTEVDKKDEDPF